MTGCSTVSPEQKSLSCHDFDAGARGFPSRFLPKMKSGQTAGIYPVKP
jgi:hypothetical protein